VAFAPLSLITRLPSYRSLPHILPARGRGRRSHLDSGHCGQVSPQTFFVAFSCRRSITVGNGPKVIEHNDPSLHQFRLRGGRVAESFVRARNDEICSAAVGTALTLAEELFGWRRQLRLATVSRTGAVRGVQCFIRIHKSLRVTPATAAGMADRLYTFEDILARIAAKQVPKGMPRSVL